MLITDQMNVNLFIFVDMVVYVGVSMWTLVEVNSCRAFSVHVCAQCCIIASYTNPTDAACLAPSVQSLINLFNKQL